jgi:hypothetical protein
VLCAGNGYDGVLLVAVSFGGVLVLLFALAVVAALAFILVVTLAGVVAFSVGPNVTRWALLGFGFGDWLFAGADHDAAHLHGGDE